MVYKNNFVAVVKCEGKILREKLGNEVRLPFGSEYSILLKNKDARRAVVTVEIDGQDVFNGNKLIVNGNEDQEVKGFMNNMSEINRFKFINKTEEIQDYRGDKVDDGLIRITYQFEKSIGTVFSTYVPYTSYNREFWWDGSRYGDCIYYSTQVRCYCNSINTFGGGTLGNASLPLSDEGITVKGKKEDQSFCYSWIGDLDPNIDTIVFCLKGIVEVNKESSKVYKPITVKTKINCSICGRKNKSSNNFCYNCGTCLN